MGREITGFAPDLQGALEDYALPGAHKKRAGVLRQPLGFGAILR